MTLGRSGRMAGLELDTAHLAGARLVPILRRAIDQKASDVHLTVGLPPVFRIDGELIATSDRPLQPDDTVELIYGVLTQGQREEFEREWQLCVSIFLPEIGHFRVTVYYHQGNVESAIRVCPLSLRSPQELGLPAVVDRMVDKRSGLILITGPTGSGKTTTFNCLIDMINRRRRCKIITVEDPVEYVHDNRMSIIVQQQVHADTRSFSQALVHILRQDPDVIGVGEMRDLETISTAITAAETGHLVLATLHTPDAAQTVDRIVDAFPGDEQQQILTQIACCLQAIVAQQLLPRVDREGRVLATEVLISSPAVRTQIRERKTTQIRSTIEMGRAEGMHTMDRALRDLYQQGIITYDTAVSHAVNVESLNVSAESNGAGVGREPEPVSGAFR